ncbi:4964_t:CDS:1, partial [Dentiscutata heterogama]
ELEIANSELEIQDSFEKPVYTVSTDDDNDSNSTNNELEIQASSEKPVYTVSTDDDNDSNSSTKILSKDSDDSNSSIKVLSKKRFKSRSSKSNKHPALVPKNNDDNIIANIEDQ